MSASDLQTLSVIAQACIALASLIASIAIPFVIYRGQKRRETLEFIYAVRTMWITIDSTALENTELLNVAAHQILRIKLR